MKKTKFLAVLLFAPLLAACGKNVEVPKFADYGKKVKADAFFEALQKVQEKSVLYNTDKKIGSFELKLDTQNSESKIVTREDKEILNSLSYSESNAKGGYCKENLVIRTETKTSASGKYTDKETSGASEGSASAVSVIQSQKVGKQSYVVVANQQSKTYTEQKEITKEDKEADIIDFQAKSAVTSAISMGIMYVSMRYGIDQATGGDLSAYSFYQNGKIFTCEIKSEQKEDYKEDDKVIATTKSEEKVIAQVDVTEGNWLSKLYSEQTETIEAKETYSSYIKGTKEVTKNIMVLEGSATLKDYKANKLDLSKYVALGFDK